MASWCGRHYRVIVLSAKSWRATPKAHPDPNGYQVLYVGHLVRLEPSYSRKGQLDHIYYICVRACAVLAACVVGPVSKVPASRLHQGRKGCRADKRETWRQNATWCYTVSQEENCKNKTRSRGMWCLQGQRTASTSSMQELNLKL